LGNIRSEKVKRIAVKLFRKYPDTFTTDFEENKKLISEFISTPSKSLKNKITGYITSLETINERSEDSNYEINE
jgi:small subunit ribosomal protein S17e